MIDWAKQGQIMVGRKRKQNVVRELNGRQLRDRGVDPKLIAARQPHRQGIPLEDVHDPAAETNFGRLMLLKHISRDQWQAGVTWRGIVLRYHAVISAPRSDALSMSGVIVGPWGGSGELSADAIQKRRQEYDEAFCALSQAGNRPQRAVNHWAVYDKGDYALTYLIRGLNALSEHFGLTKRRKFASQ